MRKSLAGIFPALTTPFEEGELSLSRFRANIEKYEACGLSGYLVLGSTGESVLMEEREGLAAIEAVRTAAAPGKIIVAGTGMPSTRETIRFTNLAAEAGADFGLVVTPFYFKGQMNARVLELYYREVADKTKIPVLMYNVPKFTGLDLPLETVVSLAAHPNIAGLKDSSGNISLISEILKACPQDFTLLQGHGSALFPALVLGARGAILAVSNMTPVETVEIYEAVQRGDYETAKMVQLAILNVNQKIVGSYGIPGIKCAMDLLGYFGGDPRPPLRPVANEVKESIRQVLEGAGLLRGISR